MGTTTILIITGIGFAVLLWSIAEDIKKHTENDKNQDYGRETE